MSDRIEKTITLKAEPARVWQALTDYRQFSTWFRAEIDKPFAKGEVSHGTHPYSGGVIKFEVNVKDIRPETYFAFTWHPCPIDETRDYSDETPTLVEFTLSPAAEGTLLRVVESGFDALPEDRRAEAFRMNNGGWDAQLRNVKAYAES